MLSVEAQARVADLVDRHGLQDDDARILGAAPELVGLFEEALGAGAPGRAAANWIVNELRPAMAQFDPSHRMLSGSDLAALLGLIAEGTLSSSTARDVLDVLLREGGEPRALVHSLGLAQVSDEAVLLGHAESVVSSFPERAQAFRNGKTGLMGFFVGQVMKRTQGKANPEVTKRLLEDVLESAEGSTGRDA